MAFWMTHLRIADAMMKAGLQVPELPFYVGSIAPDSGVEIAPFKYLPSKQTTHWHKKLPVRLESNLLFADAYLKEEPDAEKRAFYLGYLAHILTDTFFVEGLVNPLVDANSERWKSDTYSIKGDWINADFVFAKEHPDFKPYRMLCEVGRYENVFLDYLPDDCLQDQIHRVADTFREPQTEPDRPQRYMSFATLDRFITDAAEAIMKIFSEKQLIDMGT